MTTHEPRITDPRFLFLSTEDFAEERNSGLVIDLDYRYLVASDLPVLLVERIGLEAFNFPHAIDTIEDNAGKLDGASVIVSRCDVYGDALKLNDILGTIQIIAYVLFRAGKKIRFCLQLEKAVP